METIEPDGRLTAFGNQLIEVHLWLREELSRLREDVDSAVEGRGGRPRELRAHCLAFCSALSLHHTGEDGGVFPALAERFPELRPVLEELEHDHHVVTEILLRLQELLGGLGAEAIPDPDGARQVRAELDGLTALLESHFRYEEKKIVAALNALEVPGWKASKTDFLLRTARAADQR
ncbi:hemerythrin domain-containing protein [Streptosporangium sp. NBC_01755]|uniref:hemerythrin domain-containing protein n=1 Tax=unclassified Streptosporangium TaxID=2632669 RepID=UPI002DDC60FF|nr:MULTISPECIES: hemerythrin domain-containing protein [unclassified Streptosporangium]WSA28740.1 hemerythrin domain-containing protein [Streptosporangium sp. NBC_01810]WSC99807.1 hemerythrin domain-containing protein [Streptosporangium sp. NBC_01755]